jgi:hypothetical protein
VVAHVVRGLRTLRRSPARAAAHAQAPQDEAPGGHKNRLSVEQVVDDHGEQESDDDEQSD